MSKFEKSNYLTEMLPLYGTELFLRLIFAHFLADFVFQPDSWVKDRSDNGWNSNSLIYHAVVTGLSVLLFVNLWNIVLALKDLPSPLEIPSLLWNNLAVFSEPGSYLAYWLPFLSLFFIITISHFVIDGFKPRLTMICQQRVKMMNCKEEQKDNEPICVLIIDQIAHLIVLLIVLIILYPQASPLYPFGEPVGIVKIWIVLIAFFLILWPSGILISRITQIWRAGKETTGVQTAFRINYDSSHLAGEICTRIEEPPETDTLDKAGRWIGYVERLLIVTFILAGNYTAVGFLVTAKGLFRFNDPKKAEYVIIGTLLSFTIAVLIGTAVNYLIHLGGTEAIDLCISELLQMP